MLPRRTRQHSIRRRPPAAPAATDDLIAKLQQLASLKDSGVLSETEFAAAKQKLLS
ncbi:SHOCT domain-containing protein [Microbacterium sp. MYb32]|uniref:SHOCT domain-containing protein n=1 Tax=unclassified Microbacterium TaxID=2609290 RepID=UPI00267C63F1|nr:SHOCT domain-containing protein [Microbacterium sp. MYb32]